MEIVFCERCGVSIPEQQVVSARRESDGRDFCVHCRALESEGDLQLYFCSNCSVSIALSDIANGMAEIEGDEHLCPVCSRATPAERAARQTAVRRELEAMGEPVPVSLPRALDDGPVRASDPILDRPDRTAEPPLHFCDGCNASVPTAAVASGRARASGGRIFCERCRNRIEVEGAPGGVGVATALGAALLASLVTAGGFVAWQEQQPVEKDPALVAIEGSVGELRRDLRGIREVQGADLGMLAEKLDAAENTFLRDFGTLRADVRGVRESQARVGGLLGLDDPQQPGRLELFEQRLAALDRRVDERLTGMEATLRAEIENGLAEVAAAAPARAPAATPGTAADTAPAGGAPAPAGIAPQTARNIELLRDSDGGKRFAAAVELGKLKDSAAATALVEALRTDSDTFVRRACVRSLGELRAYPAVPALIAALEDQEEYVAKQSARVLEELSGEDFGFEQDQSKRDRKRAVQRAQKWWDGAKDALLDGRPEIK